jgi:hypothetical protein
MAIGKLCQSCYAPAGSAARKYRMEQGGRLCGAREEEVNNYLVPIARTCLIRLRRGAIELDCSAIVVAF